MIDEPALLKALHDVLAGAAVDSSDTKAGDDFTARIGSGIANPSATTPDLWPEERPVTNRMVPARLREFAAGRSAARSAMAAIGVQEQPVPMAPDRSPVWPAGLVGSISHCDDVCLAAVAQQGRVAAIGIDVERDVPLSTELFETIFLPEERAWLNRYTQPEQGQLATLMFSMKESAFKAQFTLSGQMFGFETLLVSVDLSGGKFWATFRKPKPPFPANLQLAGRFAQQQGLLLTAIVLSPGQVANAR